MIILGAGDRLVQTRFENATPDGVSAQGVITKKGKKILLINRRDKPAEFELPGEMSGGTVSAVDITTDDNPPSVSTLNGTTIKIEPYSVVVVGEN